MKRLFFLFTLLLAGCQLGNIQGWQPYAILNATASPAITQPAQPTHTPSPAAGAACVVVVSRSLNMRSGAGLSYGVIDWLANGETLTMTGSQRGAWVEVVNSANITGWVHSKYCKGK